MKKFIIAMTFLPLLALVTYAQESLDKIVAIVDDEIIMQSELDLQVNLEAAQRRLNPNDESLRGRILDAMINQKLLYAQAELDSIIISDEEVNQQLDMQMNYFIQQYGSQERVEKTYGMSIDRIKREFRDDTRKQMMAERVKQTKFGSIEVSRLEVEEFYDQFKDSLGLRRRRFC
jgi:peptidyl-prolyl cis-trans isomerase SurA